MADKPINEWQSVGFNPGPEFSVDDISKIIEQTRIEPKRDINPELRSRLNTLSTWYATLRDLEDKPTPSALKKHLHSIAATTEKMLTKLNVTNEEDAIENTPQHLLEELTEAANQWANDNPDHELLERHPLIEGPSEGTEADKELSISGVHIKVPRGKALVREAVEWAQLLIEWSEASVETLDDEIQTKKVRGEVGHTRDETFDRLILNLGQIFEELFNQKPTFANPPGKGTDIDSPFYRFLDGCLERYDIHANNRTGHALRERWRRLQQS